MKTNWEKTTLGTICESVSATYRKTHDTVFLVNTSDVLEGSFLEISSVENKNLKGQFKKTFQFQDILYSEIRPANRRYAFVNFEDTDRYIASTKLMVIRADKTKILPKFLYYVLTSANTINYLQQRAETRSGTFPQITFDSEISPIQIYLPALLEQKRIVRFLESIDKKIAVNNKINGCLLDHMLSFHQTFLERSDSERAYLGDYLYIKGRIGWKGLKKDEYLPASEYRIINAESLSEQGINWNRAGYISKERYEESPEIMLHPMDILISKDGTIGKIGFLDYLPEKSSIASGIFVIRNCKPERISTPFIYLLLASKSFKSFIASRMEGSVIPHLYQRDFEKLEFRLPSNKAMVQFDRLVKPMFDEYFLRKNESVHLSNLRDSLLPKLMSGEIDVDDIEV